MIRPKRICFPLRNGRVKGRYWGCAALNCGELFWSVYVGKRDMVLRSCFVVVEEVEQDHDAEMDNRFVYCLRSSFNCKTKRCVFLEYLLTGTCIFIVNYK